MVQHALILLIRAYQIVLSPLLGNCCRFEPSCSRYAIVCIKQQGVLKGLWLTVRRLARCHPWNPGGYDPPPGREGPAAPCGAGTPSAAEFLPGRHEHIDCARRQSVARATRARL